MTTPGYPDYTRLSRSGGVELASASGNVAHLQQLYRGYVGNFAYTAVTISCNVSADFTSVDLLWYSDSTFTTLVGFRRLVRTGGQFSETQYVNLSDWMIFQVETKSTNPFPFSFLSAYGCQGQGNAYSLVSNDVPIMGQTATIANAAVLSITPQHVTPGPALFFLETSAAAWLVNVSYYDYVAGGFTTFRQWNNTAYGTNVLDRFPQLDTIYRWDIRNNDTASKSFIFGYMPDSS